MTTIRLTHICLTAALAAVLTLSLPLGAAPDAATAGGGLVDIDAFEFGYRDGNGLPTTVVFAGDEVRWTNVGAIPHTVTHGASQPIDGAIAGEFDSGLFGPNTRFSFTFESTGVFEYYCTLHATMRGTIVVV